MCTFVVLRVVCMVGKERFNYFGLCLWVLRKKVFGYVLHRRISVLLLVLDDPGAERGDKQKVAPTLLVVEG